MSRYYLNLTARAWKQLRRNWHLRPSPILLWQTLVPGSVFSVVSRMQQAVTRQQLDRVNYHNAVIILGYWRSGTTLLHELLCLDSRYTYPTTHACMNPHHFFFSEASALAQQSSSTQRPMDDMEVRPGSPQEDEFALLSLGARSPYEALLMPDILPESLKLTDPRDLSPPDEKRWREIFLSFLAGVSLRGAGRPMILKSPTHGARVSTLRELLPDARFILIVRDPMTSFESVVRMWRKMFETYALGPIPSDDDIREAVLADRPRFEAKLDADAAVLPANRFATITYEALIAEPVRRIEQLYGQLELGDFNGVRGAITAEMESRSGYQAKGSLPSDHWQTRIREAWAPILTQYAALA
ncbi:MAG TPA: sulfotransferase [Candidatus Eisenbacteria bacterium]|nr:sulfotransferase [Candidatus Eisenbacteria bacterium]